MVSFLRSVSWSIRTTRQSRFGQTRVVGTRHIDVSAHSCRAHQVYQEAAAITETGENAYGQLHATVRGKSSVRCAWGRYGMSSVIAVNVGLPRDVQWQGRTVHTSVWKQPVIGRVMARRLNLDGDGQG